MDRTADTEILGCHLQKRIVNILLRVPGMVLPLRWVSENHAARVPASPRPFDRDGGWVRPSLLAGRKREFRTTSAVTSLLPAPLLACLRSGSGSRPQPQSDPP